MRTGPLNVPCTVTGGTSGLDGPAGTVAVKCPVTFAPSQESMITVVESSTMSCTQYLAAAGFRVFVSL